MSAAERSLDTPESFSNMSVSVSNMSAVMQRAASAIQNAEALVILTGAGMGVDSGLPDFRGPEGFWRAYPPIQKLGLRFEQMSNPQWFRDHPHLAWGFFGHRYHLYGNATPHAGFAILKKWASTKSRGHFVFTSNVDGHFQKAGFAEDRVVECHGSVGFIQRLDPRSEDQIWPVPQGFNVPLDEATMLAADPLPEAPQEGGGGLARPNVLMFGDGYWASGRTAEQERRYHQFCEETLGMGRWAKAERPNFVVVEIGAGLNVPTVRLEGENLVRTSQGKGTLIRINPRDSEVPSVSPQYISLPLRALDALQQLDALMGCER